MSELVQILLEEYFTGPDGVRRDIVYASSMTTAIYDNSVLTVEVTNSVLQAMAEDGVYPGIVVKTGLCIASGWRPLSVNEHTANAAHASKHIFGQAIDLEDTPDRQLVSWALEHEEMLRGLGVLGMERPQWTPHWLHIQTVAAGSGRFCYIPSSAPALVAALPGEVA